MYLRMIDEVRDGVATRDVADFMASMGVPENDTQAVPFYDKATYICAKNETAAVYNGQALRPRCFHRSAAG